MKPVILSALIFVPEVAAACSTRPLTLDDNIIVPGERIGEIEIGMPLSTLLAVKGTPRRTIPMDGTAATTYAFDGVSVAADDRVYWIVAKDSRFRTADGIAPGVEQIEARGRFGQPDCVVTKPDITTYDYGNVYFEVDNATGRVTEVGVLRNSPACDG